MQGTRNVVDLFSGGGGLSLGLERAGFTVVSAIDCWEPAVNTYRLNFSHEIRHELISEDIELPDTDVIVGGPPCQGFSSAGLRRAGDSRNSLVGVFSRLIASNRPRAFVFENVEGFLTASGGNFVFDLLEPLIEAGYRIHMRKVNAANFGVPQHRKRVIAIGVLRGEPEFLTPTHTAFGAPGAQLAGTKLPLTPNLIDTLAGLPAAVCRDTEGEGSFGHSFSPLSPDDLQRAKLMRPGDTMRDLPEHLWHDSYRRRANRRVKDGTPTERRGGAPAGLRRLLPDEPSKAITGGAINEFLHPIENRSLTIRECARLQTFPDDFRFAGSVREQVQVIGNAVPPLLGECVGRCLMNSLADVSETDRGSGQLLSFVPTLSNGMSPALANLTDRVRRRFNLTADRKQLAFQWD
ncbi:MAG: DNA cytosine methyltransferase [Planctomycetaceae bacterium]|nr:DNA cytosine methyltransferase [Planctomycetaceae bacterium]